eukprot:GILK01006174.1.p1 GENE.GILK01006174.1~~GILK01006174.1.p1  ORF type:complete len:1244 (-),score=306.03 GILK01006174.1:383-4114(-)
MSDSQDGSPPGSGLNTPSLSRRQSKEGRFLRRPASTGVIVETSTIEEFAVSEEFDEEDLIESTNTYKDGLKNGQSNILVAVRCRPMSLKERVANHREIVKILDGKVVVLLDPVTESGTEDVLRINRSREKQYAFDYAFDATTRQEEVYLHTTKFLMDGIINGYNATVFAYGATGAGKTYTMLGTVQSPGIMGLTLQGLFSCISTGSDLNEYKVKLSYLEVYNEQIRDLLTPSSDDLELREDPLKGMTVAGISEIETTSANEIMEQLRRGNRRRTMEPTAANETSSRSHAVLQVTVERKERGSGTTAEIRVGKLSMIDLAGSERASATQNRGIRMLEGANINRSLLALGNCINALSEMNDKGNKGFVPYRDSKLTRLLKDSLGGNCRTVMIAAISPSSESFEDTHNTLKYANRAKSIKTKVTRNVLTVSYHIAKYTQIIADMKTEIKTLKKKLASAAGIEPSSIRLKAEHMALQDEIVQNFHERFRLSRALLEVQQTQSQIQSEIDFRKAEVQRWEERQDDESEGRFSPDSILQVRNDLMDFHSKIQKSETVKSDLEKRLRECEEKGRKILEELPQRLPTQEQQYMLQQLYRVQSLQLENMELCESAKLQENGIVQRDAVIERLQAQLKMRERMIEEQGVILRDHDLLNEDLRDQIDSLHADVTEPLKFPALPAPWSSSQSAALSMATRWPDEKLHLPVLPPSPRASENGSERPAANRKRVSSIEYRQTDSVAIRVDDQQRKERVEYHKEEMYRSNNNQAYYESTSTQVTEPTHSIKLPTPSPAKDPRQKSAKAIQNISAVNAGVNQATKVAADIMKIYMNPVQGRPRHKRRRNKGKSNHNEPPPSHHPVQHQQSMQAPHQSSHSRIGPNSLSHNVNRLNNLIPSSNHLANGGRTDKSSHLKHDSSVASLSAGHNNHRALSHRSVQSTNGNAESKDKHRSASRKSSQLDEAVGLSGSHSSSKLSPTHAHQNSHHVMPLLQSDPTELLRSRDKGRVLVGPSTTSGKRSNSATSNLSVGSTASSTGSAHAKGQFMSSQQIPVNSSAAADTHAQVLQFRQHIQQQQQQQLYQQQQQQLPRHLSSLSSSSSYSQQSQSSPTHQKQLQQLQHQEKDTHHIAVGSFGFRGNGRSNPSSSLPTGIPRLPSTSKLLDAFSGHSNNGSGNGQQALSPSKRSSRPSLHNDSFSTNQEFENLVPTEGSTGSSTSTVGANGFSNVSPYGQTLKKDSSRARLKSLNSKAMNKVPVRG